MAHHEVECLIIMNVPWFSKEEKFSHSPTVNRPLVTVFLFSIIAVGYEARARGVTRQMRGDDAKAKCPNINLIHVPEVRGKADLTRSVYSEACT